MSVIIKCRQLIIISFTAAVQPDVIISSVPQYVNHQVNHLQMYHPVSCNNSNTSY